MPEKLVFFEKANVNGPKAREVFSFLKKAMPASNGSTEITWNFGKFVLQINQNVDFCLLCSPRCWRANFNTGVEKFLVDRDGEPAKRYEPSENVEILDIEELLNQKASS